MIFQIFQLLRGIANINNKVIAELNLTENVNEIYFERAGFYSVCVVGGKHVKNKGHFEARLSGEGNEVKVEERFIKFSFYHNGKIATEFFKFEIKNPGMYLLIFKGLEDLEVKYSALFTIRLFETKLPVEEIRILVKDSTEI